MPNNRTEKPKIDYIIDATNVCGWHEANMYDPKNKVKTSLNILLRLLITLSERKLNYQCIFDANTIFKLAEKEKNLYTDLLNKYRDNFYQVIGGIQADAFVLSAAERYKSAVISNDNFAPYQQQYKWLDRNAKPQRLFKGGTPLMAGDRLLMIPELAINEVLNETTYDLYKKLLPFLKSTGQAAKPKRQNGDIKTYSSVRKTGFITTENKTDVLFHISDLMVRKGMKVSFEEAMDAQGKKTAKHVRLLVPTAKHQESASPAKNQKQELAKLQKVIQDKNQEIAKLKQSGRDKDALLKAFAEERRKAQIQKNGTAKEQSNLKVSKPGNSKDIPQTKPQAKQAKTTKPVAKKMPPKANPKTTSKKTSKPKPQTKNQQNNSETPIVKKVELKVEKKQPEQKQVEKKQAEKKQPEQKQVEKKQTEQKQPEQKQAEQSRKPVLTRRSKTTNPVKETNSKEESKPAVQNNKAKTTKRPTKVATKYKHWWEKLEDQWQKAFNVVVGNEEVTTLPIGEQMDVLWNIKALIFNANEEEPGIKLTFALTNLSGVEQLTNLQRLDVVNHDIGSLKGIEKLTKLQQLKVSDNKLTVFENIESLTQLKVLDLSRNKLKKLNGIDKLKQLQNLNCYRNKIEFEAFQNIEEKLPALQALDVRANSFSLVQKMQIRRLRGKIKSVKF